jgi:glycosyltransferase involved in cell wall biosynthesis
MDGLKVRSKKLKTCWVVVPSFNEDKNLVDVIPRILSEVVLSGTNNGVLIVDDGSTDDTAEIVANLQAAHPQVHYLPLGRNMGKAAALKQGFKHVASMNADVVIMMDADGQDDPAELPKLLERLEEGYDLVTGARLLRRDRFVKKYTSRLYNWTTARLAGVPGRDFNSGFKVMRAKVASDVGPMMYGELHRYLTVIAHWMGHRVGELPVEHHPRLHGSSKYGLARFWRGFMDLLTVRFLMSYESRPSHLFGGLGFISFFAGVGVLGYLTALWFLGETIGDRPLLIGGLLLVVVGVQLLIFGLLAELIVYSRNRDFDRERV